MLKTPVDAVPFAVPCWVPYPPFIFVKSTFMHSFLLSSLSEQLIPAGTHRMSILPVTTQQVGRAQHLSLITWTVLLGHGVPSLRHQCPLLFCLSVSGETDSK